VLFWRLAVRPSSQCRRGCRGPRRGGAEGRLRAVGCIRARSGPAVPISQSPPSGPWMPITASPEPCQSLIVSECAQVTMMEAPQPDRSWAAPRGRRRSRYPSGEIGTEKPRALTSRGQRPRFERSDHQAMPPATLLSNPNAPRDVSCPVLRTQLRRWTARMVERSSPRWIAPAQSGALLRAQARTGAKAIASPVT
jgi:hypothetical protein